MQIRRIQPSLVSFNLHRFIPDQAAIDLTDGEQFEQTAAIFGPPGRDGTAATTFEFVQSSPLAQWTVNHNLGRRPTSVRVLSAGGVEVEAGIVETSLNQLVISFTTPFAGRVLVT